MVYYALVVGNWVFGERADWPLPDNFKLGSAGDEASPCTGELFWGNNTKIFAKSLILQRFYT